MIALAVDDPLLAQGVEVSYGPDWLEAQTTRVDAIKCTLARQLAELRDSLSAHLEVRRVTALGHPAAEIVRLTRACAAGAVLLALHDSPERATRVGSVTYQVLCQAPAVVTGWPEVPVSIQNFDHAGAEAVHPSA